LLEVDTLLGLLVRREGPASTKIRKRIIGGEIKLRTRKNLVVKA
jgi:hypothetical protein